MTKVKINLKNFDKLEDMLKKSGMADLKSYAAVNFETSGGFNNETGIVEYNVPDNNYESFKEMVSLIGGEVEILGDSGMLDKDEFDVILDALKEQKRRFSNEKKELEDKGEYTTHLHILTCRIEENTRLIDKINKMKKA